MPTQPSAIHVHQVQRRKSRVLDKITASARSVSPSTSTPTPPDHAPLTSTAWCGLVPGPALGSHRVPTRSAADENGEAVILVAVILVAVVNREIEASSTRGGEDEG